MDRTILDSRAALEYRGTGRSLPGDPDALLFVTFFGDAARSSPAARPARGAWARHGHGYHRFAPRRPPQQGALLKVRKAGLGLLMAAGEGARRPLAFVEDTAVDPARLGDVRRALPRVLDRHGLTAGFYGHCSVGCLHIRPFVDLTARRGRDACARSPRRSSTSSRSSAA